MLVPFRGTSNEVITVSILENRIVQNVIVNKDLEDKKVFEVFISLVLIQKT